MRHTQSHNSRWTAATHAGGWLSRLRLTRRRPATHTAVFLAEHPQPGVAAAALSSLGSRRGASVWSPLLSGWETAAGRGGMSSRRRPPSSGALTSSRCGECGPLAPPTGPRAHGGPWPGGISAFPLGLLAAVFHPLGSRPLAARLSLPVRVTGPSCSPADRSGPEALPAPGGPGPALPAFAPLGTNTRVSTGKAAGA